MKKCPPGVICIENYSMFFIVVCVLILIYITYTTIFKQSIVVNNSPSEKIVIKDITRENTGLNSWFGGWIPSWPYTNLPSDPLLNPYAPPYRDDRVFPFNLDPRGTVPIPINISTSAVDTTYRQVGILKRVNGAEMLLPLMGRPLFTNRDKWQFYTLNENNIKLPVTFKQKSCTSEYGCDNIYTGDSVYVDGIDAVFKATMYDSAIYKYIPFV